VRKPDHLACSGSAAAQYDGRSTPDRQTVAVITHRPETSVAHRLTAEGNPTTVTVGGTS